MAKLVSHENDRAVYTVELDWATFDQEVNKVFQKNKNRFRVPGFRPGKATRKVVEMAYGTGVFYEDALNNLLPNLIDEASKELELEPIGTPDVDLAEVKKNEPLVITISTDTMPHPTLGEYKGMEVEITTPKVEESDIDRAVENEREKNSVMRPVDRAAENGDTVLMDYAGTVDGVAFDGGTAENQTLVLGSGSFIPGFEEQLVGHVAGDEFDVNVTFPDAYHAENLAGKDAVFAIKLHEVQVKEVPEADDEFAQDVSEFDTMEEYRQSIREHLEEHAQEDLTRIKESAAVTKLVEVSNIEPPKALVDQQIEVEVRDMANQMQQMGLSMDTYLQYSGQTMETVRMQFIPQARIRVSGDLALQALVEEQKFDATEEEIDAEIAELAETYGAQNKEDFIKRMKDMNQGELVADDVRKKKALEYLLTQVNFVEKKEETPEKAEEESTSDEKNED